MDEIRVLGLLQQLANEMGWKLVPKTQDPLLPTEEELRQYSSPYPLVAVRDYRNRTGRTLLQAKRMLDVMSGRYL